MKVVVRDICSAPTRETVLPDVARVGFHSSIRAKMVAAWVDDNGFTIQVYGPFVITCDSSNPALYHQYPIIKEPDGTRT